MALSLDDLTSILEAPQVSAESGRARGYQSPQQWRQSLALDDLEDREALPRGLLTAVLTRESNGYPAARSKAGAQGLFQFMPATAQSYRIDPNNPEQAADAAAKELGQHYKRYQGDLPQTLAAWNWGSGNLQTQGLSNAPRETRNFISWVSGLMRPRSAEAAERPQSQGSARASSGPLTLEALEHVLGTPSPGAQQPAQALPTPGAGVSTRQTPQPPPASSTPEQDAAYRQWAAQQGPGAGQPRAPVSRTPSSSLVDPAARQEPPSVSLRQPSDLSIDIEKSSTPSVPLPAARPAVDPLATLAMGQGPPPQPVTPQPVTDPAAQLATAGGPGGSLELQTLPWWAKAGLATGIGTAFAGGGAALGAMTGPFAPVAVPAFEMGGSWLARKLNVELGLEEPGIVGDVASLALPPILRGTGAAWRSGLRRGAIPGTGPVRHEMAQEALEGLARTEPVERVLPSGATEVTQQVVDGRLMPAVPAAHLWQQARQANPSIATAQSWRTAGDVLRSMRNNPRITASDPGRQAAEDLLDLVRRHRGPVPIHELDAMRKTLGPLVGRHQETVGRIYGAILDDMESAVARNVPGAAPLRQAIATTRREHALDRLAGLWAPGRGIQQAAGETTQVYGKRIQNQFENLMRSRLFAGSWSPAEVADIRQTLALVNNLSSVTLTRGGTLTQHVARHGPAAVAGALGWAQEGPGTGAAYAMTVEAFPYIMAYALSTPAGRSAIRNAIARGGGRIGPAEMGAILTALREIGQGSGVMPTEEPSSTTRGR